jgi:hypothetical protein
MPYALIPVRTLPSTGGRMSSLSLAAESKIEKTFLTNLAFSWNRLANQTDRYVDFLKNSPNEKDLRNEK